MLEATLLSAVGFLLLAAAAHRFRREMGAIGAGQRRGLRVAGGVLLALAALRAGGPAAGEWSVRFLAAASLAGTLTVLALSAMPGPVLAPLRRLLAR